MAHTLATIIQPPATITRGASSLVTAAPMLPAPNTPSAVPWRLAGKKRETYATPTEKLPPAMPTHSAANRNCGYVVAWVSIQVAAAPHSITSAISVRPPNWSDQIPRNTRLTDPVSTGVAMSRPNWVSVRPSCALIWMPMMEKIIHTAKHTVKAKVLSHRARCCSPWLAGEGSEFMGAPGLLRGGRGSGSARQSGEASTSPCAKPAEAGSAGPALQGRRYESASASISSRPRTG
jgi:hypothetical protein